MKVEAIVALLLVLVIATAGAGYLVGTSSQRTVTLVSPHTTMPGTVMTSTASYPSLQLFSNVEPSVTTSGASVSIIAGIYNPLDTNVTISFSAISNPFQQPCGLGDSPTGIEIFTGYYTYANLSSASPLLLYNDSGIPLCPASYNSTFNFAPHSDKATVTTSFGGEPLNWVTNVTTAEQGYWIGGFQYGSPNTTPTFHSFGTGHYTVLVFDAWGQEELSYFEVSS